MAVIATRQHSTRGGTDRPGKETKMKAQLYQQSKIDGRGVYMYLLQSDLGDLYIVQHEEPGYELKDDYMGWSNTKAQQAYKRIATKMVNGKA